MKRLFAIAAAITLLIPAMAFAQQNNQHKGGGGGHPAGHAAPHAAPRAAPHAAPRAHTARPAPRSGARPGVAHGPAHPGGHVGRPGYAGRPGGYHPPRGNQFWHNGRYYGRVHGRPWAWPHGYSYHRWYVGGILPGLFLAPAYFYADYPALGLAPPPPGFQWVRYGPDLVLVNVATGQITDVAYGVFL